MMSMMTSSSALPYSDADYTSAPDSGTTDQQHRQRTTLPEAAPDTANAPPGTTGVAQVERTATSQIIYSLRQLAPQRQKNN